MDRYLNGRFLGAQKNTIGAAFGSKRVVMQDGQALTVGLWDTAGAERFESLSKVYYHGAGAAVVCYDPADRGSLEKAKFWVQELRETEPQCSIYVAACKLDLLREEGGEAERAVDPAEVRAFTGELGAWYTETSAKTGLNVNSLFQRVADDGYRDQRAGRTGRAQGTLTMEPSPTKRGGGAQRRGGKRRGGRACC